MAKEKTENKKPPKNGGKTNRTGPKGTGRVNRLRVVRELINKLTEELKGNNPPRVAEFLRLLALEKELSKGREKVREIRVTWVEPKTESSKSE